MLYMQNMEERTFFCLIFALNNFMSNGRLSEHCDRELLLVNNNLNVFG